MLLTFLSLALVLLTNAAFASEAPADHLLALEGTAQHIVVVDADGYTSVWLPREGLWLGRYVSVEMQNNPEIVNAVYVEGVHVFIK